MENAIGKILGGNLEVEDDQKVQDDNKVEDVEEIVIDVEVEGKSIETAKDDAVLRSRQR
ncbi:hypothetical protein L195_g046889 [Trifolium pratense]|uniref:Uncharacterized protein n=1 Tax=Trifolium pratense TaxID=57577 RepID=A0A2K3MIZ4_TRIPR|nr:hypothetical protein L195_g046889 [Trifolium pratense]